MEVWNPPINNEAMQILEKVKSAIVEDIRDGICSFEKELINQLICLLSTYDYHSDTTIYFETLEFIAEVS
jgi:hypothetical protein